MKKINILIITLMSICSNAIATNIRVNNTGVTGLNVYADLQSAHNAAATDDIIYVEPSATTYGSLTCTKKLTIVGPGYMQAQNTVSSQPANTVPSFNKGEAIVDVITFGTGSNNSYFCGLKVNDHIDVLVNGITITRCFINAYSTLTNAIRLGTITSAVISKCYIDGYYPRITNYSSNNPSGIQVINNVIRGSIYYLVNSTIENNVIEASQLSYLTNCVIRNNIFTNGSYYPTLGGICDGCTALNLTYNAFCSNATGLNSTNVTNLSYASVFTNYYNTSLSTDPWTSKIDADFTTKAGIIAAGSDGVTPRGIFGGSSPYVLAGQPPVPIITKLNSSTSGNANVPLQVTISVRSNN